MLKHKVRWTDMSITVKQECHTPEGKEGITLRSRAKSALKSSKNISQIVQADTIHDKYTLSSVLLTWSISRVSLRLMCATLFVKILDLLYITCHPKWLSHNC